jgi:iron-sulfur cluster assembly protein
MITLTDIAAAEIKKIIEEQKKAGKDFIGLQLGVKGGGCSGLSYTINLITANELARLEQSAKLKTVDQYQERYGFNVYVDSKSLLFIGDIELDYTYDAFNGGFKFNNPNAKNKCGCGSSFGA